MKPFVYVEEQSADAAIRAVGDAPGAALFLGGGTTLVDLMKVNVLAPDRLVDIRRLPLGGITVDDDGVHVGANVTNSELAWHPEIRARYPVISQALLAGMTTQLRNMATTAGNILQRTRCPYFRDVHAGCNKRRPGSGCDAMSGYNRGHAVLGTSDHCIAVSPSDLCVALAVVDAVVRTRRRDGSTRRIPFHQLHVPPGETPERETVLEGAELITHLDLPHLSFARRSRYVKVRDRTSYEFALASAAVALDLDGDVIRDARVALGGVATRPWRSFDAERALVGQPATRARFDAAADAALMGARAYTYNGFKIALARRTLVEALEAVS